MHLGGSWASTPKHHFLIALLHEAEYWNLDIVLGNHDSKATGRGSWIVKVSERMVRGSSEKSDCQTLGAQRRG